MRIPYKPFAQIFSIAILLSACSKENPNKLPSVSPADFAGKIEGFDSSGEVAANNLVAYWSFDDTKNELISGIAPTAASNDSYIDNGVRGKAIKFNGGYIYYATQIPNLDTTLRSFTISAWVQILNNGSTPTMIFTLARPGKFWGNINFLLETGQHPAEDTSDLVVHPNFIDQNEIRQDNLNASWLPSYKSPTIGANKWTHLVTTYDSASNTLQIYANGIQIGAPDYANRGTNYYTPTIPDEVIIGGWYNNIPGKQVPPEPSIVAVPMVGSMDEIRIYNRALGLADIKALYELGVAGK